MDRAPQREAPATSSSHLLESANGISISRARDIEPVYLKDPNSGRDVLCAIIEFRNLKGRPKGADG